MNRKLSFSVALSTLSLLSLAILPALADDNTTSTPPLSPTSTIQIPSVTVPAEVESDNKLSPSGEGSTNDIDHVSDLDTLKRKGAVQIKIRLEALAKLSKRVAESKLTADQKTQLQTEITANVTGLTDLGTKIAAGTDLNATRALVKSIYTDFRIFAVFIPRVNGLMHVWLSLANIDRVTVSLSDVQPKIDALKAKGVDTSKMEALIVEIKNSLNTAKTKFTTAATTLSAIKPADYPGSGATFKQARALIREAEKQMNHAREAVRRLNALIRLANKTEEHKNKLLERRDKNEARKKELEEKKKGRSEFKQERKDGREEVKNKIKELRDNLKEKIKELRNATSTAK